MSAIESSLRLEIAQYQANLAKAKGDAAKFREQLQQDGRRGGAALDPIVEGWQRVSTQNKTAMTAMKGQRMQLGMMAMQFQDIAVQAQSGTRASIILAQQGSQMLSAFGPAGMIAGAVAAIGGALYTMGEKSKEAFAAAKAGAVEFDSAMEEAAHGSASDLAAALGKISDRSKDLRKEMQDIATGGLLPALTEMVGGAKVNDTVELNAEQQRKALEHRRALGAQLAEASGDETKIAQLRSSGHDDEAAALEREINLKREMFKIGRMEVDGHIKEQLSADAIARSTSAGNPRNTKKDREEAAAIEAKLHDEKLKQLEPMERYLALSNEQEAVFASMAEKGGLFYDQSVAGLEAWAEAKKNMGDTTGLVKVLKMLEQANEMQQQMAVAAKEVADERDERDERDQKNDKTKDEQKRMAQTRAVLDLETKIAREQAKSGKDDSAAVQAFRDELNTLQLTSQIQDQLKVTQSEALQIAREKVTAERAAANAIKDQATAEKSRQQLRSRQELAAEMRVDSLRAAGKDKEADDLQRRIQLVREAMKIQQETGLDERQSAAIARQRLDDQERAAERAARDAGLPASGGRRGKIRGVQAEHGLSDQRGPLARGGPLSDHGPMTQHGGVTGFHELQLGLAGGNLPGRSGIGMGYMQAPAPLAAQHAQNAAVAAATSNPTAPNNVHQTRIEQLLRELNENIKALND